MVGLVTKEEFKMKNNKLDEFDIIEDYKKKM